MTRVLHVIPSLERGGAERMLVQLTAPDPVGSASTGGSAATGVNATGNGMTHRIVTLMPGGAFTAEAEAAGTEVTSLGMAGMTGFPAAVLRLSGTIRDWRPDVIQGWLYYGDLAAVLGRALARSNARLYWNIRCSDLDFDAYAPTLRLAVRLEAKLSGRPDGIVVNSVAGARAHEALGFDASKFIHIPNGVDTARFQPAPAASRDVRAELGIGPATRIVLHAGRVDPQKDHATLIATAALLPEVTFLAAGRGTDSLDGSDNLVRLGDRSDIAALMNAADLVLSTSAFGEGFPNVVAEGMACGTPAVSTDAGDARLLIGDTGRVVPRRDPEAAAAAISAIFELGGDAFAEMGRAARCRIETEFSLDRCRDRFTQLWREGGPP